MRSPLRWLARRKEIRQLSKRSSELEAELSSFLGEPVRLCPAKTKGGYDEIYTVYRGNICTALLRVNSPYRAQKDPIGELEPILPLDGPGRLALEWSAYEKLYSAGLSPKPLWRACDAIACDYLPWDRASRHLINNRADLWSVIERIIPAIAQMHQLGVTHLDLNLGNILLEPNGSGVSLIDFEFGPKEWATLPQQQAFDYLRIINDCTRRRRGGEYMLRDTPRLAKLLTAHVPDDARGADMRFALIPLSRLNLNADLSQALGTVFNGLG